MRQRVGALGRGDGADRVGARAPGRRSPQRRRQLARGLRREPAQQPVAAGDVVVERRRAHAERGRDACERHRLEALGVGDVAGRGDDERAVQAATGTIRRPRAIARSIAAPGVSTTPPWPGASRAGSSARSERADSSAVGRCHVATRAAGSGGTAWPSSRRRRASSRRRRSTGCRRGDRGTRPGPACGRARRWTSSEPTRSPGVNVARRPRRRARVAAAQLRLRLAGVERLVLAEQARVAGGDQHLGVRQRGARACRARRCGRCGRG